MVSTSAQRRAAHKYVDKLKEQGISQHCLYCTAIQWIVLKELIKAVKAMNLDGIKSMEIDDDGKYIRFIYDNEPETGQETPNQINEVQG